jgi:hypothetical protein
LYWKEDINVPAISKQVNLQDSRRAIEANGIDSAPIVIMATSADSVFWEESGCQLDKILLPKFPDNVFIVIQ